MAKPTTGSLNFGRGQFFVFFGGWGSRTRWHISSKGAPKTAPRGPREIPKRIPHLAKIIEELRWGSRSFQAQADINFCEVMAD